MHLLILFSIFIGWGLIAAAFCYVPFKRNYMGWAISTILLWGAGMCVILFILSADGWRVVR